MILEAVSLVADGLRDPQYGVNAMLPVVQRFVGHQLPPFIKRVYDVAKDDEAAYKGQYVMEFPCLIVRPNGPVSMDAEKFTPPDRFGDVPIIIRYVVAEQEADKAFRDMAITLRAITFTLDWFNHNAQSNTVRAANEIQLWAMKELEYGEMVESVGNGIAIGGVTCLWQVRDAHQ